MSKKKRNLYIWHRMRKKLVISIISCVACVAIMAVGVYSSTKNRYEVAVANDIDIYIDATVDGKLYAKRSGGVYSSDITQDTIDSYKNNYNYTIIPKAESNNTFDDFQLVYLKEGSTTEINNANYNRQLIQDEKLDVDYSHSTIEYVFKFENDVNQYKTENLGSNMHNAYIQLRYKNIENTVVNETEVSDQVMITYKAIVFEDVSTSEPADWNAENITTLTSISKEDVSNYIICGGINMGDEAIIVPPNGVAYIYAKAEYNTEKYGKNSYVSPWQFKLLITSYYIDDLQESYNKVGAIQFYIYNQEVISYLPYKKLS